MNFSFHSLLNQINFYYHIWLLLVYCLWHYWNFTWSIFVERQTALRAFGIVWVAVVNIEKCRKLYRNKINRVFTCDNNLSNCGYSIKCRIFFRFRQIRFGIAGTYCNLKCKTAHIDKSNRNLLQSSISFIHI